MIPALSDITIMAKKDINLLYMLHIDTTPILPLRRLRLRVFRCLGCWVAQSGLEPAGSAWLLTLVLLSNECRWCPVRRGGCVASTGAVGRLFLQR